MKYIKKEWENRHIFGTKFNLEFHGTSSDTCSTLLLGFSPRVNEGGEFVEEVKHQRRAERARQQKICETNKAH
jgi:hypothetical protein